MGSFATRYSNGDFVAVWEDLREMEELDYSKADKPATVLPLMPWMQEDEDVERRRELVADIRQVVTETMTRVRASIEALVRYLEDMNFEFERTPLAPVPDNIDSRLSRLEAQTGALPLSLRGFYMNVGAVCLNGTCQRWPFESRESGRGWVKVQNGAGQEQHIYLDGLWIDGPSLDGWVDFVREECAQWMQARHELREERFELTFAPDNLHKANVSGASGPGVPLPSTAADEVVLASHHRELWFVDYLRWTILGSGGFPGLANELSSWPPNELVEEMVPF